MPVDWETIKMAVKSPARANSDPQTLSGLCAFNHHDLALRYRAISIPVVISMNPSVMRIA